MPALLSVIPLKKGIQKISKYLEISVRLERLDDSGQFIAVVFYPLHQIVVQEIVHFPAAGQYPLILPVISYFFPIFFCHFCCFFCKVIVLTCMNYCSRRTDYYSQSIVTKPVIHCFFDRSALGA